AITVVIYLRYVAGLPITLASIAINMVAAWLLLENGDRLLRMLGRRGSVILDKVMSILLAAYAIAMIREGITHIVAGIH
ncbi:MAG: MarC family protein, partial [Crenarchaeota archaeon]|nr:MarC family protein [Thermoproteota archaeon]